MNPQENLPNSVEDLKADDLLNCGSPICVDLTTEALEPAEEVLLSDLSNCGGTIYVDDTAENHEPIKSSKSILKQLLLKGVDSKNACEVDQIGSEKIGQLEDFKPNEIKADDEDFKTNNVKAVDEDFKTNVVKVDDEDSKTIEVKADDTQIKQEELQIKSIEDTNSDDNSDSIQRVYECKDCSRTFTSTSGLGGHMIAHTENKFKCRWCSRIFKLEWYYAKHIFQHEMLALRGAGKFRVDLENVVDGKGLIFFVFCTGCLLQLM